MTESKDPTIIDQLQWLIKNVPAFVIVGQHFSMNGYLHHGFRLGDFCAVGFKKSKDDLSGILQSKDGKRVCIVHEGEDLPVFVGKACSDFPCIWDRPDITDVYEDSDAEDESDEYVKRRGELLNTIKVVFSHEVFDYVHSVSGVLLGGNWVHDHYVGMKHLREVK